MSLGLRRARDQQHNRHKEEKRFEVVRHTLGLIADPSLLQSAFDCTGATTRLASSFRSPGSTENFNLLFKMM
jgi:hypothetical protein